MSVFADTVLRGLMAVDQGQFDAVTFTRTLAGTASSITVGGVWIGDVFSWRIAPGALSQVAEFGSEEIFAGAGAATDVMIAAMRLCWRLGADSENGATWALAN